MLIHYLRNLYTDPARRPAIGLSLPGVVARVRDGQPGRDDAAEQGGDLGELVVPVAGADLRRQGRLVDGTEPGQQGGVRALVSVTARQFPLRDGQRVGGDAGTVPRRGRPCPAAASARDSRTAAISSLSVGRP